MPATSVAQQHYFGAIKGGAIKKPSGISDRVVDEFARTSTKNLPQHKADGHMATNALFQQQESTGKKRPAWMESGKPSVPHMADGRKPVPPVYRVRSTKITAQPMLADGKEKWASEAFGHNKGGLHRALGVPEDKKIPADKVTAATHSKSSHLRHMAQAARNI